MDRLRFCEGLKALSLILCALFLSGCASMKTHLARKVSYELSRKLEDAGSSYQEYPEASSHLKSLVHLSPSVDLSQYQSVENRPYQRPDVAIALAASGGGYRAANFVAGIMEGLEKIQQPQLAGNLLEEVDYFSTSSGGGFPVGLYIATLHKYWMRHAHESEPPPYSYTALIERLASRGAQNPLRKDYRRDLFFSDTRGQTFEESFDKTLLATPHDSLRLGDIFIPKSHSSSEVMLPYWIINTTIYQNAALFPFTPDALAQYHVREYTHRFKRLSLHGNPEEEGYGRDMPVAVGLSASASLPFVLTATTLKSDACVGGPCYIHLIDGGFADNLGIYSAIQLLRQDRAKYKVLIIVDAFNGFTQPFSQYAVPPEGSPLFWRTLGFATESARQQMRATSENIAHDMLCNSGAKKVLTVYLDLENYLKARHIGTKLYMSKRQQRLLLDVGRDIVAKNKNLNKGIVRMLTQNAYACHR